MRQWPLPLRLVKIWFKFIILLWCHLATQRQSGMRVHNYTNLPYPTTSKFCPRSNGLMAMSDNKTKLQQKTLNFFHPLPGGRRHPKSTTHATVIEEIRVIFCTFKTFWDPTYSFAARERWICRKTHSILYPHNSRTPWANVPNSYSQPIMLGLLRTKSQTLKFS